MAANYEEHVSGVVRSVNDKGLKLEGQESWFNVRALRHIWLTPPLLHGMIISTKAVETAREWKP